MQWKYAKNSRNVAYTTDIATDDVNKNSYLDFTVFWIDPNKEEWFIIMSAIAGILSKPQDVYFFQ